jgi:N-acetylglucosamine-6-phosphate deacetylase
VDGYHVDPVVLKLALQCKRRDRFILVTDAMPSVGADVKSFNLLGRTITAKNGVCIDEDGTLAGSDIDMATAVRNTVRLLDVDIADAARMASRYPADFLGLSQSFGRIAEGYRANLIVVDDDLTVHETWIDGARST